MIFVMALAMLKMDRAKAKWAWKLKSAFAKKSACESFSLSSFVLMSGQLKGKEVDKP